MKLAYVKIPKSVISELADLVTEGKIGQSEIIEEFERYFADWLGVEYCVATSSGTMADTIALAVLKYLRPGKTEVILPALTFIAQANAVVYNGLKPVFVDIGESFSINPYKAKSMINEKTLCVFATHLLGFPADMNVLMEHTGRSELIIEDACESLGSEYNWSEKGFTKCGTIGEMGTFSFFPSHTMTTGEGGMLATNNEKYAELARRLRNHGKINDELFHFDVIGFNGKMSSLQAAVGLSMIEELDSIIDKRRDVFYHLGGLEDRKKEFVCPHAFPIGCESQQERDCLLSKLKANEIECRNLFSSLPTQEKAYAYLGYKEGDFPMAEDIGRKALYVPCHQGMTEDDIKRIKDIVGKREIAYR